MADLEKNLEQAIEEALQPDSKAVKSASTPKKDVTNLKNDLLKKFEIIKDSSEG